jgi:hypothetical protein
MAGEISGLTPLVDPSGPLEIEVLDSADTSMSSNGTNKRATLAGPYLIEKIVNTSAGNFDFTSIPAGFRRIRIRGEVRGDSTAAQSIAVYGFLNGDTTITNYDRQNSLGDNNSANVAEANDAQVFTATSPGGGSGKTTHYTPVDIVIENYAGGNLKGATTHYAVYYANANMRAAMQYMCHRTLVAAITQITIQTTNHPTSGLVGTLSLYGEM